MAAWPFIPKPAAGPVSFIEMGREIYSLPPWEPALAGCVPDHLSFPSLAVETRISRQASNYATSEHYQMATKRDQIFFSGFCAPKLYIRGADKNL
jgi:hypothetical protein